MLSDTIHQAILDIEEYQKDGYDEMKDVIDVVKHAMGSLQEVLDVGPGLTEDNRGFNRWYTLIDRDFSEKEKERWRLWCEAGIARWAEALTLLEPVKPEELVRKLGDAVERQQAWLKDQDDPETFTRTEFLKCLDIWTYEKDQPIDERLAKVCVELKEDAGVMPVPACRQLRLPAGSTYAEGVKSAQALLKFSDRKQVERGKATPATPAKKKVKKS